MSNRESVFISAVRSFCKTLGVVIGIFIAFMLAMLAVSPLSSPTILPEKSEMLIAFDAEGNRTILPENSPVVLKINIQGIIGMRGLTTQTLQDILYDSRQSPLGNRIEAILLYIDTPGGSAIDSESMYLALVDYKKKYNIPIFAFVDGLCASGGMYIACAADKIYSGSGCIIGSVGVILGNSFFNFSTLMTKLGIESLTISQGKDKDMLNSYRPWVPGEDSSLVNLTKESYEQFVSVVAANRPMMDKQKLIDVYGAQVYLAPTAMNLGYIDVSGATYFQTVKELVAATSIQDKPYQVIELRRQQTLLSMLMQNSFGLLSGKVKHELELGPQASPEFNGKLLYLYQP
ncbi:MAG: S49 family peptidase [Chlamydiota bacterium]